MMIKIKEVKFDTVAHLLTLLSVSLFFILMFAFPRGYNIGAIMLALTAVVIIPILLLKKVSFNLAKVDRNLIIMFAVYGIGLTLINFWHQNPAKEFEWGIKFLLTIPIFLLLYRYPIQPIWFFILIMLATFIGAGVGYYNHTHYSWAYRATVEKMNIISYANIIQLLACINLLGLGLAKNIQNNSFKYLYILGLVIAFFVGVFSSVLSYTRGVWLALPFQLLFVAWFYFKEYKKTVIALISLCLVLSVSIYSIPQTGVKKRVDITLSALKSYKKGNTNSSSGLRLEMYKFAFLSAKENPILGKSFDDLLAKRTTLIKEKKLNPRLNNFKRIRLHNQYLQVLARYGLIGLLGLLILHFVSFLAFWQRLQTDNIELKIMGTTGIMLLTLYLISGLTHNFLTVNIGLLLYVILTCISCTPHMEKMK